MRQSTSRSLTHPLTIGMIFGLALACGSGQSEDSGDDEDGTSSSGSTTAAGGNKPGTSGGRSNNSGGRAGPDDDSDGAGGAAAGGPDDNDASGGSGPASGGASGGGSKSAKDLAAKLGRDHFLIGMGNDLDDDTSLQLGVSLDLRYAYLVGLLGQGGWPDWNEDGWFPYIVAEETVEAGTLPMFTLYSMAASGEGNGNSANDPEYMQPYWDGAKLLFQRLNELEGPSVVHFEPDWWAFAQQLSADPTQMPAKVGSLAPDCADLPEDMSGMGRCLVLLARKYSPRTLVGFHASTWASPEAADTADYLLAIGAGDADLVFTDILDRDAGCFEAHGEECTRDDGPWYLDETNQKHPNYNDLTSWAKTVTDRLELPIMWWQVPFGVPSEEPGGEPGHYRDNKVKYIFEHIDEFVAVGGVGALFGVGAGDQTYPGTDGDQFKNAVTSYYQSPYKL
jgi:hypothetical protein